MHDRPIPHTAADTDVVVAVSHASKKYCRGLRRALRYAAVDTVRDLVARPQIATLRQEEFWALHDVSLELRRGESVAVMGVNGAGKSTLLGVILGTRRLTTGWTTTRGRVAVLSDHGLGFEPALTGRENAYLGGALLDADRRQVDAVLDDVIAFAELEAFIDAPVRTYSEGMRARLAFAVAMHLTPDILLVDEVLAVGDLGFQRRCVARAKTFLDDGGSMLLVSHNPHIVQSLCHRCIVLDRGRVVFDGDVIGGVGRYFEAVRASPDDDVARNPMVFNASGAPAAPGAPGGVIAIDDFGVESADAGVVRTGGPARIFVRYRAERDVAFRWGFCLLSEDLETTIACDGRVEASHVEAGCGELAGIVPKLPLCAGRYALRVTIMDHTTEVPFALGGFADAPRCFEVAAADTLRNNYRRLMQDLIVLDGITWQETRRS